MIKIGICDEDVIFTNKLHETIGNILFPVILSFLMTNEI